MRRLHFTERLQLAHAGSTEYKSMRITNQLMNNHKYRPAHKFFSPNIAYYIICLPSVPHRCFTVLLQCRQLIVIVISKFLKRYSKAKRTRAPAYSRALRRIKGGFQRGSRKAQVRFPEYQEGTE